MAHKKILMYKDQLTNKIVKNLKTIIKDCLNERIDLSYSTNFLKEIKNKILENLIVNHSELTKETIDTLSKCIPLIDECDRIIDEIKKINILVRAKPKQFKDLEYIHTSPYTNILSSKIRQYMFNDYMYEDEDISFEMDLAEENRRYCNIIEVQKILNDVLFSYYYYQSRLTSKENFKVFEIYDISTKKEYKFNRILRNSQHSKINNIVYNVFYEICDDNKFPMLTTLEITGEIYTSNRRFIITEKSYESNYWVDLFKENNNNSLIVNRCDKSLFGIYANNDTCEKYILLDVLPTDLDDDKYYILKKCINNIEDENELIEINKLYCINAEDFANKFNKQNEKNSTKDDINYCYLDMYNIVMYRKKYKLI